MAEQGSDQDKSEEATPYKLEEARKSGSVAKSTELNGAVSLALAMLAAAAFSDWAVSHLAHLDKELFLGSSQWIFDIPHLMARLRYVGELALFIVSPLLALVVVGAILSNLLQSGPVFSAKPLTPDFTRINPATGFKRLFSVRSVFEAVKAIVKLAFIVSVAYFAIKALLPILPSLYERPAKSYPVVFRHYALRLFGDLLMAVIAIAVADLIYTRWEFGRRMRMSRRELKDEVKRREGDPQVRNKRRELLRELRKRSSAVSKVKDSDVLITNPQHYAIAIKYQRGVKPAPEVVAKGVGELAQHMRDLAFRHRVPIIPNPALARDLFKNVPLGAMVRENHYEIMAAILKRAYEIKQKANGVKRG
ncbi:MAG: flhB [Nevskia sp.]|nr:flhB [Nevskia sp.]